MDDNQRTKKYAHYSGLFAARGEAVRQMLMEDFRFMEAARLHSREYEAAGLSTYDMKTPEQIKQLCLTHPQGLVNFASYSHQPVGEEKQKKEEIIVHDTRTRRFMTRMATYPPFDIWSRWLLNTRWFSAIMIIVILLNSIVLMIDGELPDDAEHESYRFATDVLDFLFLTIFVAEILLKFLDNFRAFFTEGWNIFDLIITSLSVFGVCLELALEEGKSPGFSNYITVINYVRVLRIFRTMNVVTRWKRIKIIWDSVVNTFTSLFYISILMFLFFYIFAIIGIQLFDRFTKSHRTDLDYHYAFADLPRALITLFQLFTLDHWYKLLTSLIRAMDAGWPVVYCLTWILLGAFIFKNIFVGVMVNNFQNIRRELSEETEELAANAKLAIELNVFGLDDDAEANDTEKKKAPDDLVDWEDNVFYDIEIVRALGSAISPTLWPRDTLFQYFVLLETIANNLDEREQLIDFLNQALLKSYDP